MPGITGPGSTAYLQNEENVLNLTFTQCISIGRLNLFSVTFKLKEVLHNFKKALVVAISPAYDKNTCLN
jgi:hypothetical protein